jgi:hypothetical protein
MRTGCPHSRNRSTFPLLLRDLVRTRVPGGSGWGDLHPVPHGGAGVLLPAAQRGVGVAARTRSRWTGLG